MSRNVVVVTFDSLRADHCGHWDYERDTTPTMDRFAEEGVVFENAIAPASRTNPAMAGIFTGEPMIARERVANAENSRRHLERHETVAERFSEEGYATGAFCPNAYSSRYYGFDRGFDTFEDFLFDSDLYQSIFQDHLSDFGLSTLLRNARNFLRKQEAFKTWDTYIDDIEQWAGDQDDPFFLWAFSLDTHFPYLTPRKHREYSSVFDQYYYNWRANQLINEFEIDISEKERQKLIDIYDDSIKFGDVFLRELEERLSEYDPVFLIHGDHGEAFDERGIYGHFYPSLYEENVHVPYVLYDGETQATVEQPTSLTTLPDALARAAGLEEGSPADLGEDWVVATDYDGRTERNLTAVCTKDWKYMTAESGEEVDHELYDLENDSGEQSNLIDCDEEVEESLSKLSQRRNQHEDEILAMRRAAKGLSDSV